MTGANKIKILAVVGPTAGGKSALAVALAKRLGGEVISCDSMQVYRGMDIGTAKPTDMEMDGVRHHLIDVIDPDQAFSVAAYVELASQAIEDISARGAVPILCGGTGLYLDALLRGGLEDTVGDPMLRQALLAYAEEHGAHALHERLALIDPESAAATHENNVKRVVRALEIYESTGMTKSELDRRSREKEEPYDAVVIGLRYENRDLLYGRIDRRVDEMMRDGLLDETRRLEWSGVFEKNTTAAQAIGYKELLTYLRGERSIEDAVEDLKRATRRYAKRQMTWFGAKEYVRWIDAVQNGRVRSLDELTEEALRIWNGDA